MGGMLLACGAKGKRAALPNTCIMLHHPSGVARGQASDIANEGRELLKIRTKINSMLSEATGKDPAVTPIPHTLNPESLDSESLTLNPTL